MNIAWLWFYTKSTNPDPLQMNNELRAFAIYSRWRSMLRRVGSLYDSVRKSAEERAGNRELQSLSDHLLRDVGLLRIGGDFKLEGTYQPRRSDQLVNHEWPVPDELADSYRIVSCEAPASQTIADGDMPVVRELPVKPCRAA